MVKPGIKKTAGLECPHCDTKLQIIDNGALSDAQLMLLLWDEHKPEDCRERRIKMAQGD